MASSRQGSKPRNVRQSLSRYEPGAHLYATFGTHWKGGVAAMLPFGVIFFTTQPIGDAMATLTIGGYTLGPVVVGVFATSWALMSMALLHLLRFRDVEWQHYVAYAVTGAVLLLAAGIGALSVARGLQAGEWDPVDNSAFTGFLWGAPLLGAVGSVVGRWAIARGIYWHIWIERGPLPPVFDFVEGKHDRDEFERM